MNSTFSSGLVLVFALTAVSVSCADRQSDHTGDDKVAERTAMIEQIRAHGFRGEDVLKAMFKVPRHEFIPKRYRLLCDPYGDHPCSIGHDQTISQPYIVAYMTEKLAIKPGDRILEIGTGSGYQAAVLAEMGANVYSIEIVPELAEHARAALSDQGYGGVKVLTGDGYRGWPEHSPFDAIIVTCAPEDIPRALVEQLAEGGRMIVPVGAGFQRLVILRKTGGEVKVENDLPVRFVPMIKDRSD
ncbi:MAG: protein-L-isoaspartate(D-aspartate) O-methyltransferase [Verrucomicrobia bacterium]|nr:protein-L-isoaspartate(D-aspartate) O-methyltransferase [Verrucomicrobiota bacterium]